MNESEPEKAYKHLASVLPSLVPLFDATGRLPLPTLRDVSISAALASIVVEQMLSRQAASAIQRKLKKRANELELKNFYDLSYDDLRSCGLSHRKALTLAAIRIENNKMSGNLDEWRNLEWSDLESCVTKISGLGKWSAAMLGIFYIGHADIYPENDVSIVRAEAIINAKALASGGPALDKDSARPYRSYLSVTLWKCIDDKLI